MTIDHCLQGFNFDKVFSPSSSPPRSPSRQQQHSGASTRHFDNFPDVTTSFGSQVNTTETGGIQAYFIYPTNLKQGSFTPTLRPTPRTINFARNRDPRRRQRQRSSSTQHTFSLQPTALPLQGGHPSSVHVSIMLCCVRSHRGTQETELCGASE